MESHIKAILCLLRMHELIQQEHTGTPDGFAELLRISRRQLYLMIDILKDYGALVDYDRCRQTYYYQESFEITVAQLLMLEEKAVVAS